jgi:hypothetical protein
MLASTKLQCHIPVDNNLNTHGRESLNLKAVNNESLPSMCMTNSKEEALTDYVKPLHALPTSNLHVTLLPEVNVKRQEINTKTCVWGCSSKIDKL